MEPSGYNAIASPMHLFEDGELLTKEELKRRKEDAVEKQAKKSRMFLSLEILLSLVLLETVGIVSLNFCTSAICGLSIRICKAIMHMHMIQTIIHSTLTVILMMSGSSSSYHGISSLLLLCHRLSLSAIPCYYKCRMCGCKYTCACIT